MKEPTCSVFVRFRRAQRLTLKRAVPLHIALHFAATVRGERFHRPEDVFVVEDATGETINELAAPPPASAEVPREVTVAASTQELSAKPRDQVRAPLSFAEEWQHQNAQATVRGSQRLTAAVERSLTQLVRMTKLLRCSNTLLDEAEQVATAASSALEHIRHAQEALQRAEAKLAAAPPADDIAASLEALTAASGGDAKATAVKRLVRAK